MYSEAKHVSFFKLVSTISEANRLHYIKCYELLSPTNHKDAV